MTSVSPAQNLHGLILAGGKSRRMGQDKAALAYHGIDQVAYLHGLLQPFCQKLFVSCRKDQAGEEHLQGYALLPDIHDDLGPMGGILSAFAKAPEAPWLVVACDLPFLDGAVLAQLVAGRDAGAHATCFINPERGWPEPLCTLWEPAAVERLEHFRGLGKYCPRKVLMNCTIHTLEPAMPQALENANTPEDFERFSNTLKSSQSNPRHSP